MTTPRVRIEPYYSKRYQRTAYAVSKQGTSAKLFLDREELDELQQQLSRLR